MARKSIVSSKNMETSVTICTIMATFWYFGIDGKNGENGEKSTVNGEKINEKK